VIRAALVSVVLLGVTLSPLVREPTDDGFPLSTYPMFAIRRETTQTFTYALGETAGGQRRTLSPAALGTGEILQALKVVERAVGAGELRPLCEAIAARVARDNEFADIVAIRIVTGTHDAVEYLARGQVGKELERLRCAVRR